MENCEVLFEEEVTTKPKSLIICQLCDKSFKTTSCRNRHIRSYHKKEPSNSTRHKLMCPFPNCQYYFFRSDFLRQHFTSIHNIELEMEVLTFPDNKAFFTWKGNIEDESRCNYVSTGSPKYKSSNRCRFMWFKCLGYGSCNDLPKVNQQSVRDIDGRPFCPSAMKVEISDEDDSFTVEFHKTHFHLDPNPLNVTELPSEEKMTEMDDEISEVLSFDQILDEARSSVCGSEHEKVQALTREDLHSKSAVFEQKDWGMMGGTLFNSIGLWVNKMKMLGEYSPVAFFKQKGKQHDTLDSADFMIVILTKFQREIGKKLLKNKICVDTIRGANPSDFPLTSILVLDESSIVFPLAFCISSKTDEASMTVFFETVRNKVGAFVSQVFMSNDEPSFLAAWKKVMAYNNSCPINWLLCSWDIDSSWRKNLCEIAEDEEKVLTYKTLRVLLEEKNEDVFEVSLGGFINEMRDHVLTNRFSEYFYREHFLKAKLWAFCYRQESGIISDVYLEAMHQTLKNHYLDGEAAKRISKAIQCLLKLVLEEVLHMQSDFIEYDSNNCWFFKMYEGHQQSLKINSIFKLNADNWSVPQPKSDKYSIVTKKGECSPDCPLKCNVCNVCVHSFCCTCEDNLILYNICRHIHACARLGKSVPIDGRATNSKETEASDQFTDFRPAVNSEEIEASDQPTISQPAVSSDLNRNLKAKVESINSMLDHKFSEQGVKQIEATLDLLISFMARNIPS